MTMRLSPESLAAIRAAQVGGIVIDCTRAGCKAGVDFVRGLTMEQARNECIDIGWLLDPPVCPDCARAS